MDAELLLLVELICEMVRMVIGLWCLTDHSFSSDDVADIIVLLCTRRFILFFIFLCTSCTILMLNK